MRDALNEAWKALRDDVWATETGASSRAQARQNRLMKHQGIIDGLYRAARSEPPTGCTTDPAMPGWCSTHHAWFHPARSEPHRVEQRGDTLVCADCGAVALAARSEPGAEGLRSIVADWFDTGYEAGKLDTDVLTDRILAALAETEPKPRS